MPGVRVDRVLTEGTRVVGIQAGDDELRAHVVVAADGVNSFIAQNAGLRTKAPLHHLAVGVKSVVSLPRKTIEERFNLTGDEGAALAVVGDCTDGIGGGGSSTPTSTRCPSASSSAWTTSRRRRRSSRTSSTTSSITGSSPRTSRAAKCWSTAATWLPKAACTWVGEIVTDGMVVVGDAAGLTLNTGLTVAAWTWRSAPRSPPLRPSAPRWSRRTPLRRSCARYREKLFASGRRKRHKLTPRRRAFLERSGCTRSTAS